MAETKTTKWRWGVNRWWVLLFMLLGIWGASAYPPIRPHIQLPAENIFPTPLFTLPGIGDFYLTNTIVALILVDLILLGLALAVRSAVKRMESTGDYTPRGISGGLEALLEMLFNLTEQTAGAKWAKTIFPYFATITLMVLVANWMELIPGVDSIGFLHHASHGIEGFTEKQLTSGISTIVHPAVEEGGYNIIPWVRALTTDLNFTLALAIIAVVMIQVMGVRSQGAGYFKKFWNTSTFFSKPIFGFIDWAVGLLEVISELSKVLSFAFRLFGNIFAGMVMLFVIGTLVPIFAQTIFLMLEFFVGLIQAVVFGMLTMVFMAQATESHDAGHDSH